MEKPCRQWSAFSIALPLLALSFPLIAGQAEVEEVGKQPVQVDFPSSGSLKMEICSSGVKIVGGEKNRIRVAYESTKDTSKVSIRMRTSGSEGTVEVDHCPHDNFQITIEVPRATDLNVRMVAGQLDVEGVSGSKDLELDAGELDVETGRPEDYAHVDASVTTGEVDAPAFKVNKGGLFRSFERQGPGRLRLHAHVGAGQVTLR